MSLCGGISAGAVYDCASPLKPGVVSSNLILVNTADIDTITRNVTDTRTIEAITLLAGGKQGYKFEGFRQTLQPSYELVSGPRFVGYAHMVTFSVFDVSQAQKSNLEALALGNVIAVVENNEDYPSKWEVYGEGVGLQISTMTRLVSDTESQGAFTIELRTLEEEGQEPLMPTTWAITDEATTRTAVNSLLTPTA